MMKVASNVLELIGNTPMTRLKNVTKGSKVNVYAKLEYFNSTGSLKDRVALQVIEQAEKEGLLKPGYTIVGASTGNTGTSLAFVGTLKGYKVKIYETTIGKMGEEKMNLMRDYGVEVNVITPKDLETLKKDNLFTLPPQVETFKPDVEGKTLFPHELSTFGDGTEAEGR